MMKSLLLATLLALVYGDDYKVILNRAKDKWFTSKATARNQGNPGEDVYSMISNFEANEADYKGTDGKFQFRLTYNNDGASNTNQDVIIWKQSSKLTTATIAGYEPVSVPPERWDDGRKFNGLGLNTGTGTALADGTGGSHPWWWNAIGNYRVYQRGGSPGFDGNIAWSVKLEVLIPDPCANKECADDMVCVDGDCQRDCAVLDIDGFLNDCSTIFPDAQSDIDGLEKRVDTNEDAIADINVILDKLSAYSPGIPNVDGGINTATLISNENKDTLIIFLLIANIAIIIGGCIACSLWLKSQNRYTKYDKVIAYESHDENAKLQN